GAAERDFAALRSIAYGASPITTPVLTAALRTFRCDLFGVYGLTETTGGGVHAGWLAAHRRRRLRRRGGLPVPDRPDQGHDRQRGRERVPRRGRGGARAAPRRGRGRGDRRPARAVGRDGQGARRAPRQRARRRRGARRVRARAA